MAARDIDPAYLVVCYRSGSGLGAPVFTAHLPETFSFAFAPQWEMPFANTMANATNGASDVGSAGFGVLALPRSATQQVFQGSSPVEFSLPLNFKARVSVDKEIVEVIQKIAKVALPGALPGGVYTVPGSLLSGSSGGFPLVLRIGEFMEIKEVVITDIQTEFQTRMERKSKQPLEMNINLTFRTAYTPTADEVQKWFLRR